MSQRWLIIILVEKEKWINIERVRVGFKYWEWKP